MTVKRYRKQGRSWVAHKFGGGEPIVVDPVDDFTYGVDRPDEDSTGVISGITRSNYNDPSTTGIVTLSTPGVTYENLDFYGDVRRRANDLTFINCKFRGSTGHPGNNLGCLEMHSDHVNTKLINCEAEPQFPSWYRDGFVGRNYQAYRTRSFHANDGFGMFAAPNSGGACNVELWGCYAHSLIYWGQDPAHTDGTHNDCVQYQGGAHFWSVGGRYVGDSINGTGSTSPDNKKHPYIAGSCIILNQGTPGRASDVLLRRNWLEKGGVQLQLHPNSYDSMTGVTLDDNLFSRDTFNHYAPNPDYRWMVIYGSKTYDVAGLYDQRFIEDGTLLTPGRTTGIRVL